MTYLLDTNVIGALMRADERVLSRLTATSRAEVAIPEPVAAEIAFGIARLPTSRRKTALTARWKLFSDQLPRLPWTTDVSVTFGEIKAVLERRGTPIEDFDVAIAAHALAHGWVLVTANSRHMARIPDLIVEDWSRS